MKERIVLWALSGFLVAGFWTVFGMLTFPRYNLARWLVVEITIPISLIWSNARLTYWQVMFLNAATYALLGLAVELFWRRDTRDSPN